MKQKTYHAQLQDFEHGPQAKTCTNNESKHVFFKLLQGQISYSHTMSCSNCLQDLISHHTPQHTSAREEACKACMHITFHTVVQLQQLQMKQPQKPKILIFHSPPAYETKNISCTASRFWTWAPSQNMHQQRIKTCFLQIAATSNKLFSYHVLLKLSANSSKAPHTPAHLCKGRRMQSMHAHHISYSSFAARHACTSHFLLSIIFMTSADPNEPNTAMFLATTCLSKQKQNMASTTSHKKATPLTLYLPHATQQMSTTTLCLSNVIALSASDRPAKKQLSPKMQKANVCIYTWHASESPANQKHLSPKMPCKWAHSRNYISWRASTMKPDACHCASCHSSV